MRHLWLLLALAACADSDVSRAIGARCDAADECDERCLASPAEYPGGFCTVACDTLSDCAAADTTCAEDDGGVCLFECSADANCAFLGDGWRCVERAAHGGPPRLVKVCRGA